MKLFYFSLLFISTFAHSQHVVKGKVTDQKGSGLAGANVFLKGTYDGTTTDESGTFSFTTSEQDTVTLSATYVGFELFETQLNLTQKSADLQIRLTELANELNTVVITAGAFEASDEKRMAMLKPLDIVTTAGAAADITGAMQFLPGAQRVGEQEGLFVRGGSGQETKIVIDGMIVQNPFFSSLPDVQQRGRFNPFMFKGTSFSTGGYSAQYGQALSSVLLLNTTDKASNNGLGISLNLANVGLNYDYATKNQSISAVAYYGNLRPLFKLVKQNVDWLHEPEFKGSSLTYRWKPTKNGVLKVYGMYSDSQLSMNSKDPSSESGRVNLNLQNRNAFATSTYTDSWKNGLWTLNSGFSYSRNNDDMRFDGINFDRFDERTQARLVLSRLFSGNNTLLFGAEAHAIHLKNGVDGNLFGLKDRYSAAFVESEIFVTRQLAGRIGIRSEYSSVIGRFNVAPRLSFAYKTGKYSQVSLAAGQFYQNPDYRYLYINQSLTYERADHLILNFQIIKNQRTFRFETFYKNYGQLVREFTGQRFDADPYRFPWGATNNGGKGYARGFDFFWRDQKSIKNFDYWITYSFVDSERLFQQFEKAAAPTFISNHNISLITKKWFEKIKTNLSATYAFTSGRPYYNPNSEIFLGDKTPAVHNISIQASKLQSIKGNLVIFYATVDNVLNTKNIFTYRYTPDGKTRYAVGPQSYRSFFVGMQIMLSKKAKVDKDDF